MVLKNLARVLFSCCREIVEYLFGFGGQYLIRDSISGLSIILENQCLLVGDGEF
jgi:hypothetical protein